MADIKIATGVEKININDKVTLEFNPTDAEIVEKIFDVFNGLEDRQRKYQAEVEKDGYLSGKRRSGNWQTWGLRGLLLALTLYLWISNGYLLANYMIG